MGLKERKYGEKCRMNSPPHQATLWMNEANNAAQEKGPHRFEATPVILYRANHYNVRVLRIQPINTIPREPRTIAPGTGTTTGER